MASIVVGMLGSLICTCALMLILRALGYDLDRRRGGQ